MKIPTILGLIIILLGLGLGIANFYLHQKATPKSGSSTPPEDVQVVNITSTSASILWQTQTPSIGYVSFGENSNLGSLQYDLRDDKEPVFHSTHFVTLSGLNPQATYYFKVRSGPYFYPDNPRTFKTAEALSDKLIQESTKANKPITGVVLNSNLSPVDEALVLLKIAGVSPQGALVSTAGNFILPTAYLYKDNLSENYLLNQRISASLLVISGNKKSVVDVRLPLEGTLPRIILGENSDFTNLASSSAVASSSASLPTASCKPDFDLNKDKKVNSVDVTIFLQAWGAKSTDKNYSKEADFNCDNIVDQKDLDLFKKALSE